MSVTAKPIESRITFSEGSEVFRISYELGQLAITVRGSGELTIVRVVFQSVEAFRVMDEGDLLEYWPVCSTPNGWIFEITDGGWLSQELKRPASLIGPMKHKLREFLITGEDDCVSVLSKETPEITVNAT